MNPANAKTPSKPEERYLDLMRTVRLRFDAIESLRSEEALSFAQAESAAFHGRKIVEGIAFACIVAVDASKTVIPREARGQWDARAILLKLKRKGLAVLPSPSHLRRATDDEIAKQGVENVIEGIPEARLSEEQLLQIYNRLHGWLHEANPYVHESHTAYFDKHGSMLWSDLGALRKFMQRHMTSINGHGFFCTLWDSTDGKTKIVSMSREP